MRVSLLPLGSRHPSLARQHGDNGPEASLAWTELLDCPPAPIELQVGVSPTPQLTTSQPGSLPAIPPASANC